MAYKSALVYWYVDRVPYPSTIPFEHLRKSAIFDMDIEEDAACEGLWVSKTAEKYVPCIVLRLDSSKLNFEIGFRTDVYFKNEVNDLNWDNTKIDTLQKRCAYSGLLTQWFDSCHVSSQSNNFVVDFLFI